MDDFVFVSVNPNTVNNHNVMEMEIAPRPPEIKSMRVVSNVRNRYARTVVTSKYFNEATHAQQATFSIVLPDTAFIAGFVMEIKGKKYEAYVKEKAEAKQEYDAAVSRGQAAAHVAVSARDSNNFTVSANVEPQSDVTFILTYEELLVRKHSKYEIVINLHPKQLIDDFQVDVHINETRPIVNIETPAIRSGNEITTNIIKNKFAIITKENDTIINVSFHPTVEQQKEMSNTLSDAGISGQFVVQYDVERDPLGGEVLVNDGYFVHFFSPSELKPIPKLVVFVLDVSGSMQGRKIQQLKEAMKSILGELNPEDYFNIVKFSSDVQILYSNTSMQENANTSLPATKENIEKAQKVVETMYANGCTNICDALITALSLTLKRISVSGYNEKEHKPQPLIVFLTDGQANVGESRPNRIIEIVAQRNNSENKAAIFALAFGNDANKEFLKELAMKNSGFLRHIYEAADASLQLQDFYKQISSPLLTNVNFKYSEEVKEATKHNFDILFNGSEFVVTGKVDKVIEGFVVVEGSTLYGIDDFCPTIIPICPTKEEKEKFGSLERLWAYMTIKQLLDKKYEKITNGDSYNIEKSKKEALTLALKYSFVTPITSLVVVKPEKSDENDLQWGSVHVTSSESSLRMNRMPTLRGGFLPQMDQMMPTKLTAGGGAAFGCASSNPPGAFRSQMPQMTTQMSTSLFGSQPMAMQSMGSCINYASTPVQGFLRLRSSGHTVEKRRARAKGSGKLPSYDGFQMANVNLETNQDLNFGFSAVDLSKTMNRTESDSSSNSSQNTPTREPLAKKEKNEAAAIVIPQPPQMRSMKIVTNVQNLQSRTVVTTKYINEESRALQGTFTSVLPDHAFITGFAMEVNGINYEGHSQERTIATEQYNKASARNLTVGYLSNKVENLKKFVVTVSIGMQSEATFILTYEERLFKKNNKYEIVTNLLSGLTIENLEIDIKINGTKPVTHVYTPVLKTTVASTDCGNAVIKNRDGLVDVHFEPTLEQQQNIIHILNGVKNNDVAPQFVVEFNTDLNEAEYHVNDSHIVHKKIDYVVIKSS